MSKKIPPRPPQLYTTTSPRFAIVASEYHPEFVQSLINHVCKELYALEENCIIELFGVPGSFEIPVLAEMIANQRRHDVIIALGLIMQGQTRHAEFIGLSVSQALQTVAIKHSIPVIHEVLMVSHEEEARVRCINKETNRGIEAARAAFSMLRVREQLKRNTTRKS